MKTINIKYFPVLIIFVSCLHPFRANAGFIYPPINEPIISASFNADFAALVAHRYIGGVEVNSIVLEGASSGLLDLSDVFYGTSELLNNDTPLINQGQLETGVISVAIPNSFFLDLLNGDIGVQFLATDTDDGLFAIDYLSLSIQTASGTTESFIDLNNGFGIGLADNAMLPDPLPISIAVDASGTGFDEAISSKSHINRIPISSTFGLVLLGIWVLQVVRLRHK